MSVCQTRTTTRSSWTSTLTSYVPQALLGPRTYAARTAIATQGHQSHNLAARNPPLPLVRHPWRLTSFAASASPPLPELQEQVEYHDELQDEPEPELSQRNTWDPPIPPRAVHQQQGSPFGLA